VYTGLMTDDECSGDLQADRGGWRCPQFDRIGTGSPGCLLQGHSQEGNQSGFAGRSIKTSLPHVKTYFGRHQVVEEIFCLNVILGRIVIGLKHCSKR